MPGATVWVAYGSWLSQGLGRLARASCSFSTCGAAEGNHHGVAVWGPERCTVLSLTSKKAVVLFTLHGSWPQGCPRERRSRKGNRTQDQTRTLGAC